MLAVDFRPLICRLAALKLQDLNMLTLHCGGVTTLFITNWRYLLDKQQRRIYKTQWCTLDIMAKFETFF